jgi:valyl-tRNA synthetase
MTTPKLAPQYDPATTEATTYRRWLDASVFTADRDSNKAPYVIVIPPPNVTSVLHMGHGLNNAVQDVLIRYERMRGREVLWLPGTDHAGIATQNAVERLLAADGRTRHDLGREAFVERVWQHVKDTGGTILDQLRAIGASCDWSRTRFTFDDDYSHAVRRVFVTLYNQGLIYRGHRVIHWCPRCLTSLSDEEAEFHDRDAKLYHIRYPFADGQEGHLTVATTRPETMFGDICLVHHPDDEHYAGLKGRLVQIPLTSVAIPVDVSTHVEREFGTGMLKVTPAHDANDFDIAGELDPDLEHPVVIDEHGKMAHVERVPPELRGLDRDEARTQLLTQLEAQGLLEKVEPYHHAVRQCYRCQTVVEPRLSDQWFVRMVELAQPALQAYRDGTVRFIPERWGKVYENWLTDIRDWNISRQLWWGHRIPAWYCDAEDGKGCGQITVSEDTPEACQCGGALRQDPDVLDTWFSSWLWPFATLGWPNETEDLKRFYPGHTLVTGPDIIFFWVARMIISGYHFLGDRPFDTVYLNGIVRDIQHRKMSKSLGNGIDPMDVVHLYGADALRYTVIAGGAAGTDVLLDPDDLDASFAPGRNFANKIWNVGRFILTNLEGPATPIAELDHEQLELADRWILSRTQRAVAATTDLQDRFRLNEAANEIYHFFWDELADWYVEQVKPRLYGAAEGTEVARGVLLHVFATALRLLHPVMPFITEEMWSLLPGEARGFLAVAGWPTPEPNLIDPEAEDRFGRVQALVGAVRGIRAEYGVQPGKSVPAIVEPSDDKAREAFTASAPTIERLAKVAGLSVNRGKATIGPDGSEVGAHAVLPDGSAVFVPLGEAIDVEKECERLSAETDRIDKQLATVKAKLANDQFINRAPAPVVEREREKEQAWSEQRETLRQKLRSLGC